MAICIISTYPPRHCGIAQFSFHLRKGLLAAGETDVKIVAIVDDNDSDYGPEVITQIRHENLHDYYQAIQLINQSEDIKCVILQHEFGIFRGNEKLLLQNINKPVVTTFHTVQKNPSPQMQEILTFVGTMSNKVVSIANYGKELLEVKYNIAPDKICVLPNGVPIFTPSPKYDELVRLFFNRTVAISFGLLGPGKGIDLVLNAIPSVVAEHPEFLYVIIGETHPTLKKYYGESYRNDLYSIVERLGISKHVLFVNEYLSDQELVDYLLASDIFITPYRSMEQISSATLTFASHYGKACLSTPYFHAQELLGDGCGYLFPFTNVNTLSSMIKNLVSDPKLREELGAAVKLKTQHYSWDEVAKSYLNLVRSI